MLSDTAKELKEAGSDGLNPCSNGICSLMTLIDLIMTVLFTS